MQEERATGRLEAATQQERVTLVASNPATADVWTATGVVGISALGRGQTMTVTAYALCSL